MKAGGRQAGGIRAGRDKALPDQSHKLQALPLQVDWSVPANVPVRPALLGTKVWEDYPIEELLPYIDW